MADRKKVGAMVDKAVYSEFVRYVKEKRGQKRGVLGTEVENALREYMNEDIVSSDEVSNEDILTELRELRAAYEQNPPARHTPEVSTHSDGDSASDKEPPGTHTPESDSKSNVSSEESEENREVIAGVTVPAERPHYRGARDKRVAWILSGSNLTGKLPFSALREMVQTYHDYNDKTERELAWRIAEILAPNSSDLPDGVRPPDTDSALRARSNYESPRQTSGGAWYCIDKYSRSSLKRQIPTEQGEVTVYLSEEGAMGYAEDVGVDVSEYWESQYTHHEYKSTDAAEDADSAEDEPEDTDSEVDIDEMQSAQEEKATDNSNE